MMRLLIVCLVLLGWVGLPQVIQGFTFPAPIFVAAGVLLAIASNSGKSARLPWRALPPASTEAPPTTAAATLEPPKTAPAQPIMPPTLTQSTPQPAVTKAKSTQPELPRFDLRPRPTVTFVIRKPFNQEWTGTNQSKK